MSRIRLCIATGCSLLRTHLTSYLKSSAALGDHVHEQVTTPIMLVSTFISSLVWATTSMNSLVKSDHCHKSNQKCWGPLPPGDWSYLIIVIHTSPSPRWVWRLLETDFMNEVVFTEFVFWHDMQFQVCKQEHSFKTISSAGCDGGESLPQSKGFPALKLQRQYSKVNTYIRKINLLQRQYS